MKNDLKTRTFVKVFRFRGEKKLRIPWCESIEKKKTTTTISIYLSKLCIQCLIVGSKDVFFLLLGVPQSTSLAGVIALSCVVVVLLIIVCGLIWQRRRAVPSERIQGEENVSFEGVEPSPDRQSNDEQASDLNTYIELKPRPSNHEQSHVPSEYQSL